VSVSVCVCYVSIPRGGAYAPVTKTSFNLCSLTHLQPHELIPSFPTHTHTHRTFKQGSFFLPSSTSHKHTSLHLHRQAPMSHKNYSSDRNALFAKSSDKADAGSKKSPTAVRPHIPSPPSSPCPPTHIHTHTHTHKNRPPPLPPPTAHPPAPSPPPPHKARAPPSSPV
jgi:hypothetical protein